MANAADYFLAAMDKYDEARYRKQQLKMQQEAHDLQMQQGTMQLAALREEHDALNKAVDYMPVLAKAQEEAMAGRQPAQQPAQHPVQHDFEQLQKTVDAISPYMGIINQARGNSGYGQVLSLHPQQDGTIILGAANLDHQSAQPFTVDPKNNNSPALRIAPDQVSNVNAYLQGRIQANGGDPAKMQADAANMFGLQHDAQGNVFVPEQSVQGQQPTAPALNQMPQQATLPNGQPNYGLRVDGTQKGNGYFGPLKTPDGRVVTDIGVGVNIGGKEVEIPSLVPTLTKQEIDHLVQGGEPTPGIIKKASDFAVSRMKQGKSPFAQYGEQVALPVDSTQLKPGESRSTTVPTKVRFSTKVNNDPKAFYEMAQSPNLDVTPSDEKILGKVEENPFHLTTVPASISGKAAALFLRAKLITGEQAMNLAQTGFTNMNTVQLAQTMATLNLTKTQLKKAEYDLYLEQQYGARDRQLDQQLKSAQIDAQHASQKASEATASWQVLQRENELQDRADKKQGELTNGVRTTLDRGFDSFAGKFELPEDTAANLKPQYINAVATAVQALGAEKQFINNAGANDESRAIYERTNNLMHDPKAQEALRARGVDPTDVSQVAYYATVERYAPKRLAALDNVSKGAPSSIVRPEYATPAAVPTVKETPAANGVPLSVDDQRSLNEKNQKFVSGIVTSYFIGTPTDTDSYNQKKAELQGKADAWGSALLTAYKANGIDPNKAFAADSATSVLLKATEHMDKMNVGDSQGEVEGAAVYSVATAIAGMDSSKLNSSWARDKALLSQAGVDLKAYAAKVRETVSAVQANKLQLPKGMDAATYVSETWLKPMVFKAPTKEQSPYIRPLNLSMPFRDDGTPNPYYHAQ